MKSALLTVFLTVFILMGASPVGFAEIPQLYVLKIQAFNSHDRSQIANTGVSIEFISDDHVVVTAHLEEKNQLERMGLLIEVLPTPDRRGFPPKDSDYHDYSELTAKLQNLNSKFPDVTRLVSIGKSVEGRDIWSFIIGQNSPSQLPRPQVIFMGGHHAREHLSVEVPLRLVEWFLQEYEKGQPQALDFVRTREIHVIPAVNPDGLEYDIAGSNYRMWRKNRKLNHDGTYGVDLNRNYSYQWGTGGASSNPRSDTYRGPTPFSEPETQAIRDYVKSLTQAKILLSFHTFSELILYPWGYTHSKVPSDRDRMVYIKMADTMAEWNGYTPQQSSELYIASGDTTDWSYGDLGLFSFTFEMDPSNQWDGGFYPGDEVIVKVVEKNKNPFLYLIEYADDPYRTLGFGIGAHE